MVATPSLEQELAGRGFRNLRRWSRGVDTELFHPRDEILPRPAAPDHLYRRPGGGGEEHRGLPEARPARQQGRGRRRPAARRAQPALSRGAFRRPPRAARSWPATMPRPTSSSSRAAPTPSAWCCWRRWPPACRWPPFRCQDPWMWSTASASASSRRIWPPPPATPSRSPPGLPRLRFAILLAPLGRAVPGQSPALRSRDQQTRLD